MRVPEKSWEVKSHLTLYKYTLIASKKGILVLHSLENSERENMYTYLKLKLQFCVPTIGSLG